MHYKEYIRPICLLLGISLIFFVLIKSFVINNPVFDSSQKKGQSYSWEEYLNNRQKRNIVKMNKSYQKMMAMGRVHLTESDYNLALMRFHDAKTIFPEKIEARKYLCYCYLMKCQENIRHCRYAKREIYYAMQYIEESDLLSNDYLSKLVTLVEMDDILKLPEGEALAAIF